MDDFEGQYAHGFSIALDPVLCCVGLREPCAVGFRIVSDTLLFYRMVQGILDNCVIICFAVIIETGSARVYQRFHSSVRPVCGPLQWLTRILMCYSAIPLGGPPLPYAAGRGVAQPGSAPGSGPGGRRFKSSRPDHFSNEISCTSGFTLTAV